MFWDGIDVGIRACFWLIMSTCASDELQEVLRLIYIVCIYGSYIEKLNLVLVNMLLSISTHGDSVNPDGLAGYWGRSGYNVVLYIVYVCQYYVDMACRKETT